MEEVLTPRSLAFQPYEQGIPHQEPYDSTVEWVFAVGLRCPQYGNQGLYFTVPPSKEYICRVHFAGSPENTPFTDVLPATELSVQIAQWCKTTHSGTPMNRLHKTELLQILISDLALRYQELAARIPQAKAPPPPFRIGSPTPRQERLMVEPARQTVPSLQRVVEVDDNGVPIE